MYGDFIAFSLGAIVVEPKSHILIYNSLLKTHQLYSMRYYSLDRISVNKWHQNRLGFRKAKEKLCGSMAGVQTSHVQMCSSSLAPLNYQDFSADFHLAHFSNLKLRLERVRQNKGIQMFFD